MNRNMPEPNRHTEEWNWEEPLQIPDIKGAVEKILVPVDGSPGSEKGLAYASMLASITRAELVVVVAYDPPLTVRRRGILQAQAAKSEMEEDAKELAREAAELLTKRGHDARAVVVRGDPVEAILEIADSEGADMIVMGRRGLGRLAGLLLGSVSERVARHAGIPVLLAS
jgi:nucleotide-binding universal stress UspA family protein